jgi:hypothetical protein
MVVKIEHTVGGSTNTVGFGRRALVENGILNRTKLRFVFTKLWPAVRESHGSGDKRPLRGTPLTPRLAKPRVSVLAVG